MAERFTIPVEFRLLDDAREHGHEVVVALAAELDGANVAGPDERGVIDVTLEAGTREEAVHRIWEVAQLARVSDYFEDVGGLGARRGP
jgi:hypothetical protein